VSLCERAGRQSRQGRLQRRAAQARAVRPDPRQGEGAGGTSGAAVGRRLLPGLRSRANRGAALKRTDEDPARPKHVFQRRR